MKLYNVYVFDFLFKFIYCLISFFFTLIICFTNINNFFLFEIVPFLKIFYHKRFIITQITHLFNVAWILSFFYSLIWIFPLISFNCLCFFKSSWFKYQKNFYKFFILFILICYINFLIFCHFNIIPMILNFFLNWELVDKSHLLRLETEISFYYYILWLLLFKNNLSLIIIYICTFCIIIFIWRKIFFSYSFFKTYKNLLGFTIIIFIYLLIPPDFMLQFLSILFVYFIIELLFFFFCILFYKYLKIIRCLQ